MSEETPKASFMPREILKQPIAIWMYFIAVIALAGLVLGLPFFSIWTKFDPIVWNGWTLALGGLITMVGVQGARQNG